MCFCMFCVYTKCVLGTLMAFIYYFVRINHYLVKMPPVGEETEAVHRSVMSLRGLLMYLEEDEQFVFKVFGV